jgi:hypothetical protein
MDEICFSPEQKINDETLKLTGFGLLEYLKFDMYVAAFYLPADKMAVESPLSHDISKMLILHYKRGIKVSWMNSAAEKIIKKNPNVDYGAIEARVKQIGNAYEKVEKGDQYALAYDAKKQETTLFLNEKAIVTIEGHDFASAYLGIWVGDYPANKTLQKNC